MKKNNKNNIQINKYIQITIALIVGFGVGFIIKPQTKQLNLATALQKEVARQEVSKMYLNKDGVINCTDPTDPIKPKDRTTVFNNYLQVNGYANRAVVRGCNNTDQLLAKTKQGNWIMTEVNMNLDARVNPKWQKECLIQDITVTDTVTRPENESIDNGNFQDCQKISKL